MIIIRKKYIFYNFVHYIVYHYIILHIDNVYFEVLSQKFALNFYQTMRLIKFQFTCTVLNVVRDESTCIYQLINPYFLRMR